MSVGKIAANGFSNIAGRIRFALRRRLSKRIETTDGEYSYVFLCESMVDVWRAQTLLVKEKGTVEWIKAFVRPGDVFYDIGANIGLYTMLAAKRVGPSGRVYSFEPHLLNAYCLLRNVHANGCGSIVRVMSGALNDSEGYFDFNYHSEISGSSMSQLHETKDDQEREFKPVFSEYKSATTVDRLIEGHAIKTPNHIKIDVDGNELLILQGMSGLLQSAVHPSTIQVEVNVRYSVDLMEFMSSHGYELSQRHYTLAGEKMITTGARRDQVSHNAIFVPRASAF